LTTFSETHQAAGAQELTVPRTPLGALLVDAGFIDQDQLAEALHEGTQTGLRLGEVVVRRGWASEDDVARLLAEQWGLGYVDRASIWFDVDALGRLSREDAQQLEALPVRVERDRVMVAVAEPTEQRLADLRRLIGADTVVVVVPRTALEAGIRSELLTSRRPETEGRAAEAAVPDQSDPPDLVARAQNVADFILTQATITRDLGRRIEQLEADLAESRAAAAETKTQLAAVLQLFDVLKGRG
jgi:type II secretion system (T2SS) protein E